MTRHTSLVPPPHDLTEVVADLAAGLELSPPSAHQGRVRYFDTFDWRLHVADCTLRRHDGTWELVSLADGRVLADEPARSGPWPRFARDFAPEGEVGQRLRKLMKMRALVHLLTLDCHHQHWDVRNADAKIVLRLVGHTCRLEKPHHDTPLVWLEIDELRGYEKHARDAAHRAAGLELPPAPDFHLDLLLDTVGLVPRSYSSRFHADLSPAMPSREAFQVIGRTLLRAMRQNEAGLRADLDTEFLHDFRVAVRRQRSAFGHFGAAVDATALGPFRQAFQQLGQLTGPLRDLDAELLDRDHRLALLPADLHAGLAPRFAHLAERRVQELDRLRRALAGPDYRGLVSDWEAFLADPPAGPLADLPLLDLARRRLRQRHRRVLNDGRAITPDSPDQDLHRLRIQCKKLRYLLEFTRTVFASDDVAWLVRHLKTLQDNLGEFNDLSVQRAELADALAAPTTRGKARVAEAASLGGLLTALAARHHAVRSEFAAAFASFDTPKVRARVKALRQDHPRLDP